MDEAQKSKDRVGGEDSPSFLRRRLILGGLAAVLALPWLWLWGMDWYYSRFIYTPDEVPPERIGLVFGARIYPNGRLSGMLQDRVETAVQLYEAGRVQKLIMSGDNRFVNYNEPARMREYAIQRGVAAADIQPDYAGRRTYDTCYRARAIFGVESAVLITQAFHLPRALFICRSLGIEAVGVVADRRPYDPRSRRWSQLREIPATWIALWDVLRRQPPPVLGQPIPIE